MTAFQAALGPKQIGLEILVHVARHRLTGALTFTAAGKTRQLMFRDGRPESASEDGEVSYDKAQVVAVLRIFAASAAGRCTFAPADVAPGTPLGIDTLGESLMSAMQVLPSVQLDALLAARGSYSVEATPLFAKLASAITRVSGITLAPPDPGTFNALVGSADPAVQRAWATLLLLGGLKAEGWALHLESPATAASPAPATAPGAPLVGLRREIAEAHSRMASQTHYDFLNVAPSAPAEAIRKAYFEIAKRWHADRLVGADLDEDSKQKAQELFHRADEANRVLSNPDERKTYDWVLERQAQGLPTDPQIVMEAEGLFHRGETLIRRGQVAAAEPLLRQAVQLNKGEAEFWAYLGFAIYGVQGSAGVAEARECLAKALKMRDKLDVAHEFLGRIFHAEGERNKAQYHLSHALELNPKNTFAERELRLLNLRQGQEKKPEKDKGLLGRLLKK